MLRIPAERMGWPSTLYLPRVMRVIDRSHVACRNFARKLKSCGNVGMNGIRARVFEELSCFDMCFEGGFAVPFWEGVLLHYSNQASGLFQILPLGFKLARLLQLDS